MSIILKYKFLIIFLLKLTIGSYAQKGSTCQEDLIPRYGPNRQWGYTNLIGEWVVQPIYTKVTPYIDNKAVVMKGNLYGVIDCEGNIVLPPQYEMMTSLRYGKFWTKQKHLWSLIDVKGNTLLTPQYSEIAPIANTEFTWVRKEDQWGLINEKNGIYICKPQYKIVQIMSENASLIETSDKFGVVNHVNCQYLIEPNITKVKKIAPRMIIFKQNNKWGLFSEFGVIRLNPEFDTLLLKYNNLLEGKKEMLYGLYDLTGKEVLAPEFSYIGDFSEGYFIINKNGKYGYATRFGGIFIQPVYEKAEDFQDKKAIVKISGMYGIIDIKNKFLLPPQYTHIIRNSFSHYFSVKLTGSQKGSKTGSEEAQYYFYNSQLKKVSTKGYDTVYVSDSADFTRVELKGKTYIINYNTGCNIISQGYDAIVSLNSANAIVVNQEKYGVIDKTGKEIIVPSYDSLSIINWGNRKIFEARNKDGSIFIIDEKGKILFKDAYESLYYVAPGALKIRKNNKYGIIKTSGDIIAPVIYDTISSRNILKYEKWPEWPALIVKNGKYGLINEKGEEIVKPDNVEISFLTENLYSLKNTKGITIVDSKGIPLNQDKYEQIHGYSEGLVAVRKGRKWGYLNIKGILVIPIDYHYAGNFLGKIAVVKKGELYGAIDIKGKQLASFIYSVYENKENKRILKANDGKEIFISTEGQIK